MSAGSNMVVLILIGAPAAIRGDTSRWLLEISPGIFVGNLNARVRERLWRRIEGYLDGGRAVMVFPADNEQHLSFLVHQPDWQPVDYEGVTLINQPHGTEDNTLVNPRKGFSNAAKYCRARKFGHP